MALEIASGLAVGLADRSARLALFGSVLAGAAWLCPLRPGVVVGTSMTPTLRPWQVFIYDRRPPRLEGVRRGELVLVRVGEETCIKRVFALGGDSFWAASLGGPGPGGVLQPIRIGVPVRLWQKRFPRLAFRRIRVPRDTVYVLGDGTDSLDSRQFGPVPRAHLVSRVVFPRATAPSACGRVLTVPPPVPAR